jgi:hypothetical protein
MEFFCAKVTTSTTIHIILYRLRREMTKAARQSSLYVDNTKSRCTTFWTWSCDSISEFLCEILYDLHACQIFMRSHVSLYVEFFVFLYALIKELKEVFFACDSFVQKSEVFFIASEDDSMIWEIDFFQKKT